MKLKHLFSAAILCLSTMLSGCGGSGSGDNSSAPASPEAKLTVRQKAAAGDYAAAVQALYIAYYGRPADPDGLANFEAALAAADAPTDLAGLSGAYGTNATVRALIDSFGNSKESNTLYGNGSTSSFVTAIFQSVLGRAPAAAGLAYWTNAIDNDGLTKGNAAASIMVGAMTNQTTQGLQDEQAIANKLGVSIQFTNQVALSPSLYAGQAAAASARAMLAQVSSTTNLPAFQATVDAVISSIAAAQNPNLASENTAALTLSTSTPSSLFTTLGPFNGNLGNCGNVFMPGCGFTPVGAACVYYPATATNAAFLAKALISYEDANGNTFGINLISPNRGSSPFTVGESLNEASGTELSYFLNAHGEFLDSGNGITVTAVSMTGMTLAIKNLTLSGYLGAGLGTYSTEVVNGTVQFTCDPGKSQTP